MSTCEYMYLLKSLFTVFLDVLKICSMEKISLFPIISHIHLQIIKLLLSQGIFNLRQSYTNVENKMNKITRWYKYLFFNMHPYFQIGHSFAFKDKLSQTATLKFLDAKVLEGPNPSLLIIWILNKYPLYLFEKMFTWFLILWESSYPIQISCNVLVLII